MKYLLLLTLFSFPLILVAQCDTISYTYEHLSTYGPPCDNIDELKEKYVLAFDEMKMKHYAEAVTHLEGLLKECPCLTKDIFVLAEKAYKKLEREAEKPEKIELQDKLLALYDLRLHYYGEGIEVLQKKGQRAFGYLLKRDNYETQLNTLDTLYTTIFNQTTLDIRRANLIYYVDIKRRKHRKKLITEEEHKQVYQEAFERIDAILEAKRVAGEDTTKWHKTKLKIENSIPFNCFPFDRAFIEEYWLPKIKANKYNLPLLRKVIKYSLAYGSLDDPAAYEALIQLAEMNEGIHGIISIADGWMAKEQKEKALRLYQACLKGSKEESQIKLLKEKIAAIK